MGSSFTNRPEVLEMARREEAVLSWGDNLTCACVCRYSVDVAGDWELLMGFLTWPIRLTLYINFPSPT